MKEKISAFGSVIAAILASICCIGPLVIVALGLSGAGGFPALIKFRPLFIILTILLLVWSWWIVIKKAKCCVVEGKSTRFLTKDKILLYLITAIVIILILLPYILMVI